ncbi:MAG: glycosyltransferase family 39 protein [Anaerolineae bacterium]
MSTDNSIIEPYPRTRQFPEVATLSLILLLAALLRFYGLGQQSLWADEGNSWGMAIRPLAAIGPAAAGDIHPPLYYYLLNLWVRLFGTSEVGLRSLSAVCGWLLVLVTYLWARHLAGKAVATVAGAAAAISPFAIYYSQEARAYALVTLLAASSTLAGSAYLWAGEKQRPMVTAAVAYVLLAAALLWSHYLASLVLLLLNLFAFAWLLGFRKRGDAWRQARTWLLLQAAVVLSYLPWLPTMLQRAGGWPAISAREGLGFYLLETARLFTLGPASERMSTWAWLALIPILPALSLLWHRKRALVWWALVVAYALWPAVGMWLLSLLRPAYRAKFLLIGLPAYHILVGAGVGGLVAWLWRRWHRRWLTALVMVLAFFPLGVNSYLGLHAYHCDPQYARDNYRSLARFLEAVADPNDAIILNAPGQVEVFSYYYRGLAAVYPLPQQRPPQREQLEGMLAALAQRHPRVYAILWATAESDPASLVETWLDLNAYKALDSWYGNVRLATYEVPPVDLPLQALNAIFADKVALASYAIATEAVVPGRALAVELHWRLVEPVSREGTTPPSQYKLFIQALDAHSNIIGQRDCALLSGHKPMDTWEGGEVLVDRQALPVFLGTPPGQYTVIAGLYDAASGVRLLLPDGSDHLILGQMQVAAAPRPVSPEALRPLIRRAIGFGTVRLVGWDNGRLGEAPERIIAARPGQPLSLVLYWQVLAAQGVSLQFELDGAGGSRILAVHDLLQGTPPPEQWQAGQVLRDPHILFLPTDVRPGSYILSMKVATAEGSGQVDLARIDVRIPDG